MNTELRPIERRVLAMREQGLSDEEIANRIKKRPDSVERIAAWAALPGRNGRVDHEGLLTPKQQRVVDMRAEGLSHAEIADRFKRSERFIRQVEGLARFRQYQDLLG